MDRTIVVGGFYRHFKGFLAHVLYIARHTETGEKLVIYRNLHNTSEVWARPVEMFAEKVDIDGRKTGNGGGNAAYGGRVCRQVCF